MGRIQRMDPHLANMIAAGEVVERPVNVIKELIENSIDAGATSIKIDLMEAGLKQIRLLDNGSGMDETDLMMAFERHATSKIKTEYDLFHITSLGFRGEALPSIASVSQVIIQSSVDGVVGNYALFEAGKMVQKKIVACSKGTDILISKLFYNTPARLKYIKSPAYELTLIVQFCEKFALGFPQIQFRLTNDQKILLQTPGNHQVLEVLHELYGLDVVKTMRPFSVQNRDYQLNGYLALPQHAKTSRYVIHIIVNGRPIRSIRLQQAIQEGYGQLIPSNKTPIVLLTIQADPSLLDVNIHPSKLEIKFSEESRLLDMIRSVVFETLNKQAVTTIIQDYSPIVEEKTVSYEPNTATNPTFYTQKNLFEEEIEKTATSFPTLSYIGQYLGSYLLFQSQSSFYFLDQHAAAERVRYERYRKIMGEQSTSTVELLVPVPLSFTTNEMAKLELHQDSLKKIGILLELSGPKTFVIRQIPAWFPKGYEESYTLSFIELLLLDKEIFAESVVDELAILLACKHSLKANHFVSQAEAEALITSLQDCQNPYSCPHGRPILIEIEHRQIERWFRRVN